MIRTVISNILRFTFLLLLQALVINRLDVANGMVYPFIYIFALLMLPLETPRAAMLFLAFFYGLAMDAFSDTLGMHASACLVMAFAQGILLKVLSPREGYEYRVQPTIQHLGLSWYLSFAGILTFIHHLWLFNVEVFRMDYLGMTLLKTLASTLATLVLMVIGQYLIFKQRSTTI